MVRLITRTLSFSIQMSFLAIRLSAPWLLRFLLFCLTLSAISVASFWRGVPNTAERMANTWVTRACDAGFPTIWTAGLYWVLFWIAILTIVFSWIVTAFITVFTVSLAF